MFRRSLIRLIHRRAIAVVVWAMVPLAAWAGAPMATCACVKCHCADGCGIASRDAPNCSFAAPLEPEVGGCGCHAAHAVLKQHSRRNLPGSGFTSPPVHGCRLTISSVASIQLPTFTDDDISPVTDFHPLPAPVESLQRNSDRAIYFDTGPPVDLVVTLRRLVI